MAASSVALRLTSTAAAAALRSERGFHGDRRKESRKGRGGLQMAGTRLHHALGRFAAPDLPSLDWLVRKSPWQQREGLGLRSARWAQGCDWGQISGPLGGTRLVALLCCLQLQ